jgi:CubicO group peptidase (beta-lactamase class C family)
MKFARKTIQLLSLIFFVGVGLSCSSIQDISTMPTRSPETLEPDYWPTNAWQHHTPEEEGMDSEALLEFFHIVEEQQLDLHSVVIVRNGYIVMEANYYPFQEDIIHQLYSATKSITGILVGMAIEDGYLSGVDSPVLDYFSQYDLPKADERMKQINLEHLLTMTSGLRWNEENYSSQNNDSYQMRSHSD